MPKTYTGLGFSLLYPDSWTIADEATSDDREGIMLESPGGAFLSINLLGAEVDVDGAVDEAAQAMTEEYEDIETEPYEVEIGGQLCIGTVQRFYYLDFVVASKLFTIELADRAYLIQIQGEDRDMDAQAAVFEAVLTSLVRSLTQPNP